MLVSNKKLCAWLMLSSSFIIFLFYLLGGLFVTQKHWYYLGYGFLSFIVFGGVGLLLLSRATYQHQSIRIVAILSAVLSFCLIFLTLWQIADFAWCIGSASTLCGEPQLLTHTRFTLGLVAFAVSLNILLGVSILVKK